MMRNKKVILIFALSFCLSLPAQAQLKLDPSALGGRVFGSFNTFVEQTVKKVNAAGKKLVESNLGQNFKTRFEKLKALQGRLEANINKGKELYNETSQKIAEGKNKIEEVQKTYEEKMAEIKNSQVVSTALLQKQIQDVSSQMQEKRDNTRIELGARLKDANNNAEYLSQMLESENAEDVRQTIENQLAETRQLQAQYQADLETLDDENSPYWQNNEEYQALNEQKQSLEQELNKKKEALIEKGKGLAASAVKSMIKKSPAQKKEAYEEMEAQNFVAPDTPLDHQSVSRVNQERRDTWKEDMANALVQIVERRKMLKEMEEKIDNTANNIEVVDATISALSLKNEQEIQEIKLLQAKMKLELAEIRLKTSADMVVRGYRQNNPDKDPSKINLDNYVLTEQDIEKAGIKKKK